MNITVDKIPSDSFKEWMYYVIQRTRWIEFFGYWTKVYFMKRETSDSSIYEKEF